MNNENLHKVLTILIALVWLVNGLYCKVLNAVPRHQEIVGQILGSNHARTLTILIGLAEILMAIWIVLKFKPKLNAIVQIVVVITMNIIETFLAPELLLWGKFNLVFAALFVLLVYYNQFKLSKQ